VAGSFYEVKYHLIFLLHNPSCLRIFIEKNKDQARVDEMIKKTRKTSFFHTEHAQTMVEFALVFPIILLITYGIMEFGRMVFIYAAVTSSAREGARYGTASGLVDIDGDGDGEIQQYAYCAGIKNAVRRTAFLIAIPDSAITITYQLGGASGFTTSCASVQSNPALVKLGDRILVQVSVQFQPMLGNFLGISNFTINTANARTILKEIKLGN
jgi:Flp pilus assembly protein TadG